jgi:hypothetical protein
MKVVRLIRGYRMYQPGETAGFDDALADQLIKSGTAVDEAAQKKADLKAAKAKPKADADAKSKAED